MWGRAVATFAMLPHWKGFCVDDAGETMTAWEAIEQVQNVAYCMTKSQTKEGRIVSSSVPYGFHFDKVRPNDFNCVWLKQLVLVQVCLKCLKY